MEPQSTGDFLAAIRLATEPEGHCSSVDQALGDIFPKRDFSDTRMVRLPIFPTGSIAHEVTVSRMDHSDIPT